MIDEILDILKARIAAADKANSRYAMILVDDAREILKRLAASRASQWVKCSERLPSNDEQPCWWLLKDGRVVRGSLDRQDRIARDPFYHHRKDYTHWHPDTRPAPPRADAILIKDSPE